MPKKVNKNKDTSFKKMLEMSPKELSQVHPDNFNVLRSKDIGKFSEAQLFALTPEQIKRLKPISFREVNPKTLELLIYSLENRGSVDEEAIQIIREGINKAQMYQEEVKKIERLRNVEWDTESEYVPADLVAARLSISLRYLQILSKKSEIIMFKDFQRLTCLRSSVVDYLNRNRVPGGQFDENGYPILRPEEYEKPEEERDRTNYVPVQLEPLTDIPLLYPVEYFAEKKGVASRTFIQKCNVGYFDHFRVGKTLRMSEEDYERSVERRTEAIKKKKKQAL